MNKHHLVAAVHYLLFKIHLSLATNRMELTDEEQELLDLLLSDAQPSPKALVKQG